MTAEPLDLDALPVRERDAVVAQVLRFMDERGYVITHPGAVQTHAVPGGTVQVESLLAEMARLRAALTTARRDALTEAAEAAEEEFRRGSWSVVARTPVWLRARAAREEAR